MLVLGGALLAAALGAAPAQALTPPIYREVPYGPSPAERMTIFSHSGAPGPLVVLVHGGGWRLQPNATEFGSQARSLQKQGAAVFDINYDQDSPTETAFPLETNDVRAAVLWATAHAAEYGADPSNVVLLGGSAGGLLVERAAELLDEEAPGTVRGVVSLSGPTDFTTLIGLALNHTLTDRSYIFSIGQALGCTGALASCPTAYAEEWSPALHVPAAANCPTWMLLWSEVDAVAKLQAEELRGNLLAAGCSVSTDVLPTGHGFSYWSTANHAIFAYVHAN